MSHGSGISDSNAISFYKGAGLETHYTENQKEGLSRFDERRDKCSQHQGVQVKN